MLREESEVVLGVGLDGMRDGKSGRLPEKLELELIPSKRKNGGLNNQNWEVFFVLAGCRRS